LELLLNGETSEQEPDADFLREWFRKDHDLGDFLILRAAFGELRATAPQAGTCLLQAEGAVADGAAPAAAFNGEVELPRSEAARVVVQFLSGEPAFRVAFERNSEAVSFSWFGWIVGVLIAAAGWWAWYVS
jgi:hypothetical protein